MMVYTSGRLVALRVQEEATSLPICKYCNSGDFLSQIWDHVVVSEFVDAGGVGECLKHGTHILGSLF